MHWYEERLAAGPYENVATVHRLLAAVITDDFMSRNGEPPEAVEFLGHRILLQQKWRADQRIARHPLYTLAYGFAPFEIEVVLGFLDFAAAHTPAALWTSEEHVESVRDPAKFLTFCFELEILALLRQRGFEVQPQGYGRIEAIARQGEVQLAIECKCIHEPDVLHRLRRVAERTFRDLGKRRSFCGGRIAVLEAPTTLEDVASILRDIEAQVRTLKSRTIKTARLECVLDERTRFLEIRVEATATTLKDNLLKVIRKFRGRREAGVAFVQVPSALIESARTEAVAILQDQKFSVLSKVILAVPSAFPDGTLTTKYTVINNPSANQPTAVLDDLRESTYSASRAKTT